MVDRTRIERFRRSEAHGDNAEMVAQFWDQIPYRLRAAMVETLEGQHTRQGVLRRHLQIDDGFRMNVVGTGPNKGQISFTEFDGFRWRKVDPMQARDKLLSSRTASIWGRQSGYSHARRKQR